MCYSRLAGNIFRTEIHSVFPSRLVGLIYAKFVNMDMNFGTSELHFYFQQLLEAHKGQHTNISGKHRQTWQIFYINLSYTIHLNNGTILKELAMLWGHSIQVSHLFTKSEVTLADFIEIWYLLFVDLLRNSNNPNVTSSHGVTRPGNLCPLGRK